MNEYKQSTREFEQAISHIVRCTVLESEQLSELINWPVTRIRLAATLIPQPAIQVTTFYGAGTALITQLQTHTREIIGQVHLLYQLLNLNLITKPKPKQFTNFLTTGQKACIADMALNSPLNFETVAKLLNLNPKTLQAICYEIGGIYDTQRIFPRADINTAVKYMEQLTTHCDQFFQTRINALKRKQHVADQSA